MLSDIKFAFRQLAKSPGFASIAVLSLALGIGANTALFSVMDDLLLRSLPVPNPNELVLFRWLSPPNALFRGMRGAVTMDPASGLSTGTAVSYFMFERLSTHNETLSDLFAFGNLGPVNLSINSHAGIARAQVVTGGYFSGLGLSAARGRLLTADDDRLDAPPTAVISYRFWQQRFGGTDDALGKTVRINDLTVTIVGVTPRVFEGALQSDATTAEETPDVTLPIAFEPQLQVLGSNVRQPLNWWLHVMGRLRPSGQGLDRTTAEQVRAQFEPIFIQAARDGWTAGTAETSLESQANPRLRIDSGAQGLVEMRRTYAQPLRLLMGIVGLVLIIACANVANLLLARGAARRKDFAVRLSVGASRSRLIRQLLAESLVLALVGGALGVLFAYWGRHALLQLRPMGAGEPLDLNFHVLAFTVAMSVLTGLLFGLVPAWHATRVDLNSTLKDNSGGAVGPSRFTLRRMLMVGQVALSVVVLVGAGLFLRTLVNLRSLDTGFNRENLIVFSVNTGLNGYRPPQTVALFDRIIERLGGLPGVHSVALSNPPPLANSRNNYVISVDNPRLHLDQSRDVAVNTVSPAFFATLGIPLMSGRSLTANDTAGRPRVVVVNETFARTFFPGDNPIGRSFALDSTPGAPTAEIVGIVRDAHCYNLRDPIPPAAYTSVYQDIIRRTTFIVRTAGESRAIGGAIRAAIHELDPDLSIFDLGTVEDQVTRLVSAERLFALLSAFFGAVALVLVAIGLYGLLAHQVTSRTREIGIRMALGAQLSAIIAPVLSEGLRLVVSGLVIGLVAAIGLSHFVTHLLFGVQSADPVTFAGVGLFLLAIAAVACWLPARRAAKVDPMVALRAE